MASNRPAHPSRTTSRKREHVALTLREDVGFRTKTTGLERWTFEHNALPELSFAEIDLSTSFLGRTLGLPLMVSCMTGGYAGALRINRTLAAVCEEFQIVMGVGSERQALESGRYLRTFSVVREAAPTIPVVGNLGAAEVARLRSADPVRRLAELIRADAFAVHLNPLQEFVQPEGTPDFRGVLRGIGMLVRELPIPVVVKEIGAGISAAVARRLLEAGVRIIDIAGAGGTSWAGVEALRSKERPFAERWWDWGIPTVQALREVAALRPQRGEPQGGKRAPKRVAGWEFTLIASGGITGGLEAAKCIALGADLAASARPVLLALARGGEDGLRRFLENWAREMRGVMFLTGSRTIGDLRRAPLREDVC